MSVSEDYVNLLKRVRELCHSGQVAGAELELHSLYRRAGCPSCVKVVLAALLARRGQYQDAHTVLRNVQPNTVDQHTPEEVKLAISILVCLGLPDEAEALGKAFHSAYGRDARLWLSDMSVPGAQYLSGNCASPVEDLAQDLIREPKAIQALVFAQMHKRDLQTVELLRQAIRRIAPMFENDPMQMAAICRAMAELSVLAGDHAQARRWAHRGLEEDPYNASLALLINRLRDDGRSALPPRTVLVCVATAHPDYPDVQAALIRRETADGRLDDARDRLKAWLEREPYSPQALELRKEIAA